MERTDAGGPLLEASADRAVVWGVGRSLRCRCGSNVLLVHRRCRACKARNPAARLVRKRRRVESWIRRRVEHELLTRLDQADGVPEVVRRYEKKLGQIAQHPLPERRRWENTERYLKRCLEFIPYMFENSSPAPVAREIDGTLPTSGHAISDAAVVGTGRIVADATGVPLPPVARELTDEHARRVTDDLGELLAPYVEALKVVKIHHDRMTKAWAAARPVLERPLPSGTLGAAWAKARATLNPIGPLLRFGTAIWRTPEERSTLLRLEAEIARFHRHAGRFAGQSASLAQRRRKLRKRWRVSLTRHISRRVREQIADADPETRQAMVDHVLNQNGLGSRLRALRSGRLAGALHR